jgi:hypothetical protein
MLVTLMMSAQLKSLSLDLRNNYSSYVTQQPLGDNKIKNYNQNYILSLLGYAVKPELLTFDFSTSLSDNSSSVSGNSLSQKQRTQNIGFYNFSATVLPVSTSPVSVYASKSDTKNNTTYDQQINEAIASYYAPSSFLYQTDVKGIRWSAAKNDYLPSIELGLEKNSSKGKMLSNEIQMTNTNLSGHISNSSANDISRYSLQYIYNDVKDLSYRQNYTNHNLQFYGASKLSEKLDAFSSAIYMNRQNSISRTMEFGGSFVNNQETLHNLRLTSTENSSKINGINKTISNSLQYQTQLSLSERLKLNVISNISKEQIVISEQTLHSDRGQLQAQLNQIQEFPLFSFNGTYALSIGEEKQIYGNRQLVYSSQVTLNAASIEWNTMRFTVRENIDFARSYVYGNMLNNTMQAELLTMVIPRTLLNLEVERTDIKSSAYAEVSNKVIHALSGSIKTALSMTTSLDVYASKRRTNSWYLENMTTANIALNQNGFIKNLNFQARGEYNFNSFTNITVIRGEAAAIYQFYAFALQAKYMLFSYSRIQTSGFALEVSRPIHYNFSQQ